MNERIKRLVYEAEKYALNKANDHDGDEDYENTFEDDFQQKFAELLVRECADIINHRADTSADYLDSNKANDHARQVQRDCATTIKQHFGVE